MWYLSGKNDLDYISYYLPRYKFFSDDHKTIFGGYGPRLLNMHGKYDQIENVVNLLKKDKSTRHAVIQLFDADDIIESHKDIPCTCTLQFLIRNSKLMMFTNMRSNDAFLGLPHDIFVFTMLQEIIARRLDIEPGVYNHFIGSLHLYKINMEKAMQYIDEGWQSNIPMPSMPNEDPVPSIKKVLEIEEYIRCNKNPDIKFDELFLDEYWKDIIRLLLIFKLYKNDKNIVSINDISEKMNSTIYKTYIDMKQEKHESTKQLKLNFSKT